MTVDGVSGEMARPASIPAAWILSMTVLATSAEPVCVSTIRNVGEAWVRQCGPSDIAYTLLL